MKKAALREKYKLLRKNLSEKEIEEKSQLIVNQLLTLPIWDFKNYHIFLPIKRFKEVNTLLIINILKEKKANIIIPKINIATNEIENFLLNEDTILEKNTYGILEPQNGILFPDENIEIIFIPLLAYDFQGNRVGYGGGFYDRFLAKCSKNVLKIGISFFKMEENTISDIEKTDIPLDFCVNPYEIIKF